MHVLFWGLGFLLFPDLINVVAITGETLLNSRKEVPEQLGTYEIVTPTRVNEAGDLFPTSVHFRRRRRSVDESLSNASDQWALPRIHYRISAFGQSFHLNLTLESGFIAPLYTVTVLGVRNGGNLTDFSADEEEDTEYQHCFYKGHVNAKTEHTAVISLCSGLLGTFRSPQGEFFVEPLHSYQGEHYQEEHTKPHIVYRKDAPKKEAEKEACDTSGTGCCFNLARPSLVCFSRQG